ncbi:DUF4136 domain-containing protein [Thalassotalea sp. HSM 43]|uniref:DUF4136 domain-containing protein n=1 Tax=Thalassotalea sp. HSM 43 TaxID=2552945 RepID=UPI0010808DEF|nr:DUF4136 domain-containing protein [Thalassotalea sp. HSM 43]QBY04971.1 DUF4136 domain-containing protein [Thalassotalea sp. HSM 43]
MRTLLTTLLLLLTLFGCASPPETLDIEVNADGEVNRADYKTFSWINDHYALNHSSNVEPQIVKKVAKQITSTLIAMGYTPALSVFDADFTVGFTLGARDKMPANAYPSGYNKEDWLVGPLGYAWAPSDSNAGRAYKEGELAIDIFDGKQKKPVWHGYAKTIVTQDDNVDAVVEEVVAAILQQF